MRDEIIFKDEDGDRLLLSPTGDMAVLSIDSRAGMELCVILSPKGARYIASKLVAWADSILSTGEASKDLSSEVKLAGVLLDDEEGAPDW